MTKRRIYTPSMSLKDSRTLTMRLPSQSIWQRLPRVRMLRRSNCRMLHLIITLHGQFTTPQHHISQFVAHLVVPMSLVAPYSRNLISLLTMDGKIGRLDKLTSPQLCRLKISSQFSTSQPQRHRKAVHPLEPACSQESLLPSSS